jgi:uncharacterized membrane protein YdcZ (DUF606 family)
MEREMSGSTNPLDGDGRAAIKRLRDRASIALGIGVICLLFLIETSFAHRTYPSAASPFVWAVLGGVGAISFVLAAVWRARAGRSGA